MKFEFEYQEDTTLEKFARKPQLMSGMKLLKMCRVRISDIEQRFLNFGRDEGKTDIKVVALLRTLFRNETYLGHYYEPPVVTPDGKLVAGKHRFKAAKSENQEYIWAAVVQFQNTKVLRQFAIRENLTSDPKNVADIKDVVSNVVSAIQNGDCNKNKTSVRSYLKEIGWNTQISRTIDAVMTQVDKNYVQMDIVSKTEVEKAIFDAFDIDVSDSLSWIATTLRGGADIQASDRWSRLWRTVFPLLVKGIDVNVAVGLTNILADDVDDTRKNILNNFLSQHLEMCQQVVDAHNSGNLGKINFYFKSQVEGETDDFIDNDTLKDN